ncbi:MAG: type II toxin-antitoxin system RelE/ParE family toxin [Flavobacteriales bacterium]|nr:type II toxin-antitoxin system RelE/ParE family toxin [Flavobacteriales bacterium]
MELNKPIEVRLLPEAEDYFEGLPKKIQVKLLKSFDKTQVGLKGQWFKQLKANIWEFRERDHQKFYRILAFWDRTENKSTIILTTHGFNKKTNKTPAAQIAKAERIRIEYFRNKKS